MEDLPNSFRRRCPRRQSAAQAFTALRKVQCHLNATLPAQEENCGDLPVEGKPLSNFRLTAAQRAAVPKVTEMIDLTWLKNFKKPLSIPARLRTGRAVGEIIAFDEENGARGDSSVPYPCRRDNVGLQRITAESHY
jgi:hypothetical protein